MKLPEGLHEKLDQAVEGVKTIPKLVNLMLDMHQEIKDLRAEYAELSKVVNDHLLWDKEKRLLPDDQEGVDTSQYPSPTKWIPAPTPFPEQPRTVMYGCPTPNTAEGVDWKYTTTSDHITIGNTLDGIKKHLFTVLGDVE